MTPARMPTGLEFQTHARGLAASIAARLIESSQLLPDEAFALGGRRCAFASTIHDETTYAVALHELGHLRVDATANNLLLVDEEHAAWAWARQHALVWTDVMELCVVKPCLDTYAAPAAPQAPVVPSQRINWEQWK